ncbi:hypothetical protein E4100_03900 [Soehngenia longivitae]|uniref:Twitching motility protein PilT n=1 Tax=Soehngenia longivitae TaxID=2562294 RepID=A0A4Z0D777_9FIRM|nr:hypothetical protein [Soehngenia longivitae]TFZ40709.1 hypothetical protein E4100_03900 [Soehngenia longivitae]
MVKFILGEQGSGKTKWLIDNANKDMLEGNGNIVFVDVDDEHIFSLNYNVRLINAMEFNILNVKSFYGFLCGIMSMDYDLEKIYVDGIYKLMNIELKDLVFLIDTLEKISEKFNVEFYINVDYTLDKIPENLKSYCYEIEA